MTWPCPLDKGGEKSLQLSFSPDETLFILINRHVTWEFPLSSGVPIGYCWRNCLVISWFKCFQNLQVNLGTRGFTWSWPGVMWFRLCLVTGLVISLVIWWCFYDVVFRISWFNNKFWLGVALLNLSWLFQACESFSKLVFCTVIIVAGKLACNRRFWSLGFIYMCMYCKIIFPTS